MVNRYPQTFVTKAVARGQWELGLRGALFGAELLFSPWEAGRPAPEKALRASYLGVDLSRAWWFRDGFYAGTSMELRYYDFGQWQDATRTIPEARGRLRTALKLGVWRSELRAHVLGGINLDGDHRGWWTEGRLASLKVQVSVSSIKLIWAGQRVCLAYLHFV